MIIDAHAHVWRHWPNTPCVPGPDDRGSYQNLLFEMDMNGVDRAVLVSARIEGAGDNNNYAGEAAAAHPDRFVHFVDVDSRWSATYHRNGAADRLGRLVTELSPRGASHYLGLENDGWLSSGEARTFFSVARDARLLVSLAAGPAWFADVRAVARAFPETPFIVNHLGLVVLHPDGPAAGLHLVLSDEDLPNLLVKVSGLYYGHPRPWSYPYPDRMGIVRILYENWGPGRLLWGSDFPSALRHISYRQSLEVLREHAPFIAPADLPWILGGTLDALLADRGGPPR
jgi:predicted TIM-barrel fold metal-dependent hydrolase